jgi:uncharacterized protein
MKFALRFLMAVGVCLGVAACQVSPVIGASAASPAFSPLTIKSGGKVHKFKVEVVRTPEEQARGMMFRESLAPDAGMIFPMAPPRPASFWMKNTVIPLDMIFIRADGSIARIAAEAIPYSLDPVSSGEPVAAVLEIAGGRAAELGISEDDVVVWNDTPK